MVALPRRSYTAQSEAAKGLKIFAVVVHDPCGGGGPSQRDNQGYRTTPQASGVERSERRTAGSRGGSAGTTMSVYVTARAEEQYPATETAKFNANNGWCRAADVVECVSDIWPGKSHQPLPNRGLPEIVRSVQLGLSGRERTQGRK